MGATHESAVFAVVVARVLLPGSTVLLLLLVCNWVCWISSFSYHSISSIRQHQLLTKHQRWRHQHQRDHHCRLHRAVVPCFLLPLQPAETKPQQQTHARFVIVASCSVGRASVRRNRVSHLREGAGSSSSTTIHQLQLVCSFCGKRSPPRQTAHSLLLSL